MAPVFGCVDVTSRFLPSYVNPRIGIVDWFPFASYDAPDPFAGCSRTGL
jgi:hypothetical protein